jgi:hypothetical protein
MVGIGAPPLPDGGVVDEQFVDEVGHELGVVEPADGLQQGLQVVVELFN